jgi:hypothetical protein
VGINPGGLTTNEGAATVRDFVKQTGVTFPVGFETDPAKGYDQLKPAAGISPFPVDVIIGPDDRIAYLKAEYDPEAMNRTIEALLGP